MLSGTVYGYDNNGLKVLILDIEDYEIYSPEEVSKLIEDLSIIRIILESFSNNHSTGVEKILYEK